MDWTLPAVVGGVVLLAAIWLAARFLRSVRSVADVPRRFARVQRAAFENIVEPDDRGDWLAHKQQRIRDHQCFFTRQNIVVFYTIALEEGSYMHRVTMQARNPGRPEKHLLDLGLILAAELTAQLRLFPEEPRPQLQTARSDRGTYHIALQLSQDQQDALRQLVMASRPRNADRR